MMRTSSVVLAISALVVATACGKTDETASGDSATMAMGGSSAAMEPAAPAALTDANIVYILDQANVADSTLGALAETKGSSAEVRNFGKLMQGEHHALRQQGQDLATKLGVTPAMPTGDQSETNAMQTATTMGSMEKGAAWDKAYIDHEVSYHQQVLQTATAALGAAQNAELKDLIGKAAPIIQKHLDTALELQKKLSTM
ncbi:MAG TPA: DUF4142 domain-containing protein [Gemmatimonas sp.]|nr:DUF4142 domain-containing protein [Gemmatimonas sp.]